jgi:hypothetical protein
VVVNHTDAALRHRQATPLRITADKVILAAGTFGSTEILMRSRDRGLPLSSQLGHRFSGNGDLFAAAYDTREKVDAVATESVAPQLRKIGPTITARIDHRQGDPEHGLSIQELAVPGPLRRLFEEVFTTSRTLHHLGRSDWALHTAGRADRNAVDHDAFDRTVPLALIGRDSADGELVLSRAAAPDADDAEGDGAVQVQWPQLAHDPRFDRHHECAQKLLTCIGGELLPNPVWKLQPDAAAEVLGIERGPLLTVHPLGGCPMGDNAASGVVDDLGRVYDPERQDGTHDGLVVLDGAIVPTSLGINPALTIAALSLRAIEALRNAWGFSPGPGVPETPSANRIATPLERPKFRTPPPPVAPKPTEVQLIERLRGNATLADGREHHLELTLHTHPVPIADLMSRSGLRRMVYEPGESMLRVFDGAPSSIDDGSGTGAAGSRPRARLEARATIAAGSLEILRLAPSTAFGRMLRALPAWLFHRGPRDIVQRWAGRIAGLEAPRVSPPGPRPSVVRRIWRSIWAVFAIAMRAGAARTLDYTLDLGNFEMTSGASPATLFGWRATRKGKLLRAHGRKTLTYDGGSSPWQQLMELDLARFPGMSRLSSATLTLDLPYLAREGVALLRVVRQQDHVHALIDLASFNLYMLRTILDGHMWTFRRPDRVPDRVIHRLPGAVRGLPPPAVTELAVADVDGKPVHLRLTRYRPDNPDEGQPPVLLIHGYSASGTTFVHPTLRPGLAGRLVQDGRDVWVLDLRSSTGMPWATHPWTFEQIGFEDIPVAVNYVVRVCGKPVDVVAHCMGAAMLSMALLGDIPPAPETGDAYPRLRRALRARIRRIVLSQVGPLVMMSPSNQLRAFLMRYVRQLIPMGDYRFRPDGDGSMADMLLDRLLATLPYPPDEVRRENPRWPLTTTPWVRSRRRMDALYGQVFKLSNMSRETLEHLDDFFGPMNVETVSQVVHFARTRTITDAEGRHVFATRARLRMLECYEILSIHGTENCLADVSTADLLEDALDPKRYRAERIRGFGHQDCLIGEHPREVFETIVTFLREGFA